MDKTPRLRLLEAANELFYAEGIGAVGVSRLIERADVGQMSLWRTFGSKQGLVETWLHDLDQGLLTEMRTALDCASCPREGIAALFDVYARRAAGAYYLGCPLVKAAAEAAAGTPEARTIARTHKQSLRAMFASLAAAAGARQPDLLATQLLCLMEGAAVAVGLEAADEPVAAARAAALTLFDAALAAQCPAEGRRT
jgi:AcrR family transcriptional regulator